MLPNLAHNTLLSSITFSYADYILIYDGYQVNIYDGQPTKIKIPEAEVLKG